MLRMDLVHINDKLDTKLKELSKCVDMVDCMGIKLPDTKDLHTEITYELFDWFVYESIVDEREIAWKEYFHALYELVIIDDDVDIFTLKSHNQGLIASDSFKKPSDIPPTPQTRHIQDLFDEYIELHKRVFEDVDMNELVKELVNKKVEIGKSIVSVHKQIDPIKAKIDIYTRLTEWSLH